MSLILSGTDGLSDVDGSAATPAIRGTDANTGIFFPAADTIAFAEGGAEVARFDSAGNLGLGVTPSAWRTANSEKVLQIDTASLYCNAGNDVYLNRNWFLNTSAQTVYLESSWATSYGQIDGKHIWYNSGATAGTAGNTITFTQAMTLDASGNLLVGNTGATNKRLAVSLGDSTSNTVIYAESGTSYTGGHFVSVSATAAGTGWYHFVGQSSGPTNNILIYGNGNIENANNSYNQISDIKIKENITDATPKLEKLMQVRVVNYNLKGELGYETHTQIGVIAQELEQVFPGLVYETPDQDKDGNDLGTTTKGVKMSVFVPMLIKAMQEQQALITTLTARITALESA